MKISISEHYDNKIYQVKTAIINQNKCIVNKLTKTNFIAKYYYGIDINSNDTIVIKQFIFNIVLHPQKNNYISIDNSHNKNVYIYEFDKDKNKKLHDILNEEIENLKPIDINNIEFVFLPYKYFDDIKTSIQNELLKVINGTINN